MTVQSEKSLSLHDSEKQEKEQKPEPEPALTFHQRSWWAQVPFTSRQPPPAPKTSIEDADIIPEATAHFLSLLTFGWLNTILSLGYARPLEAADLYRLQDHRKSALISSRILESFERRRLKAEEYNRALADGTISPGWQALWWTVRGNKKTREQQWRTKDGRRKPSLVLSINDSVKWFFWSGGIMKVIGDTAQVTSPLVVKAIINFSAESYAKHSAGVTNGLPPVGKGIGLAFALLALQVTGSFCTHHFFYRSAGTGVLVRGGLITAIYTRSLHLSGKARSTLTNGKLVNHISTDVSRIDFCCALFHMSWAASINLILCLVLLLLQIGPSALAGFALFALITPLQTMAMKKSFAFRANTMIWTDKRAKLLQELLSGMKIIKFFTWETPFLARIFGYRQKEMKFVRSLLLIRAANNALAITLPTLASVLSFITYSLSGHDLNPAVIFTSLTLFNLLRLPLMMLPMSFSAIVDGSNAVQRLYGVFEAELLDETQVVEDTLENAIEIKAGSFSWDSPAPEEQVKSKKKKQPAKLTPQPAGDAAAAEQAVFKMKDINLTIPRGKLVAIVGPVGTGKSSLLQAMIGEMRRTGGSVTFGGSVSYCPQSAWIQNATIRENITFGRPFEEDRYWKAIEDACFMPDLELLPHGEMTEVGEKGISLSGGQKQRLNIARAIYCNTDIQLFDDPLSALDAHVGKAVFHNVLLNSPTGKTRVLVTHALHFLPQVDYIYTIIDGRIAERGTYTELMRAGGEFSKFVTEFGSQEEEEEEEEVAAEEVLEEKGEERAEKDNEKASKVAGHGRKKGTAGVTIMQTEERNTGAVNARIYKEYLRGPGMTLLPLLIAALVLTQGTTVMSSYWLVYWQERHWPRSQGFYMGIYAGLGIGQAVSIFISGSIFALLTYFASQRLHRAAIERVMRAPMSFFETTPLGRIMNRFSKDIDTIDNLLGDSARMLSMTASNIAGALILIAILLPWFLIPVAFILVCYAYFATFYRASARELKRLDAILRSSLYAHFSESLSGLSTIRAYGETERFRLENESRIDIENRAYWLTVANQRWLGIRLDFMGISLAFFVSILVVATRFSISPAQTGLALSYILSVQQMFGWLVRQSAELENNMNSVERIVHYATEVEQEAPHELPDKKPASPWPSKGEIVFKEVVLKYRPELPPVLKDLTMSVKAGEKIGIVGRTGAGKSSIMTALYRLVELSSGSITIDGVDVSKIGLTDLRSGLSIIPQDAVLFSGTLRSNLDPFNLHDDARLWDALKRSYLVERKGSVSIDGSIPSGAQTPNSIQGPKLTLDSVIEDEGGNLSIGQRSLVSLARALVLDTKIIILDEATASVDFQTDRQIQETISTEFYDRTILCIAHRLRTIIGYDRICVLDAGQIAEMDTPTNLFHKNDSIFRAMCERSGIALDDIRLAAKSRLDSTTY